MNWTEHHRQREVFLREDMLLPIMTLLLKGPPEARARSISTLRNLAKEQKNIQIIRDNQTQLVSKLAQDEPGVGKRLGEYIEKWCLSF